MMSISYKFCFLIRLVLGNFRTASNKKLERVLGIIVQNEKGQLEVHLSSLGC